MDAPVTPEADGTREGRRRRLNKLDRILFAIVFLAMILLTVGIISLYVPRQQRSVESYGYDLSNLLVDRELVSVTGRDRYEILPLVEPRVMTVQEVLERNEEGRGKFLVSADRVAGIVVNGEARAYPLREMNWHEVVNDTVGGVPVAVTYSPLSDAVVAFDRRVGDRVLQLRHSSLLYNSNLLMQDWREEDPGYESSLFSQLQFRAIAGPLAGTELDVLPMEVTTWGAWREKFPETLVVRGLEQYEQSKLYRKNPYGPYLLTGELKFPVAPLPPGAEESRELRMRRVVAVREEEAGWRHWLVDDLAAMTDGPVQVDVSGEWPVFSFPGAPPRPAVYACHFAWYAVRHELSEQQPPGD
jgi:hypothetical protein